MVEDTETLPSLIAVHYECVLHSVITPYYLGIVSIGEQVGSGCHQIVNVENTICCTLCIHFRLAVLSSVVDNGPTVCDELGCLQLCVNQST